MPTSKEQQLDERQRLLAMREYLRVRARPEDESFEREVVDAAVKKIGPVINQHAICQGESIIAAVANQLNIQFEDVRSHADIRTLEQRYLVEQKELGFGRLAQELADPSVDALLFQRMNAPDRWVAVLNLQETESRAYWSRPHEIMHRLAEPPQRRLPFFRHRTDYKSRVERIIDFGAAELAFPRVAFGPRVEQVSSQELTWDLVQALRQQFAPTSSLQSGVKAVLRYWPYPAFLLKATVGGRRGKPDCDVALRVEVESFSPSAEVSGIRFFPNMRVPMTSPIFDTYRAGYGVMGYEELSEWTTSRGDGLPSRRAFTSGLHLRTFVYGLVSLI